MLLARTSVIPAHISVSGSGMTGWRLGLLLRRGRAFGSAAARLRPAAPGRLAASEERARNPHLQQASSVWLRRWRHPRERTGRRSATITRGRSGARQSRNRSNLGRLASVPGAGRCCGPVGTRDVPCSGGEQHRHTQRRQGRRNPGPVSAPRPSPAWPRPMAGRAGAR